jgi:hypothetical protein
MMDAPDCITRKCRAGKAEWGFEADVDHFVERGVVGLVHRRPLAGSGVIHQAVEPAEGLHGELDSPLRRVRGRHVGGEDHDIGLSGQLPGEGIQALFAPGDRDDPITAGGKAPSDPIADTGAGAGYQQDRLFFRRWVLRSCRVTNNNRAKRVSALRSGARLGVYPGRRQDGRRQRPRGWLRDLHCSLRQLVARVEASGRLPQGLAA